MQTAFEDSQIMKTFIKKSFFIHTGLTLTNFNKEGRTKNIFLIKKSYCNRQFYGSLTFVRFVNLIYVIWTEFEKYPRGAKYWQRKRTRDILDRFVLFPQHIIRGI
jgi:hypothetical protein